MNADIPDNIRSNPNLMAFVLRANAAITQELGAGGPVAVSWRLGADAADRAMLEAVIDGAYRVNFVMADFIAEPEGLRAKVRESCGRPV